MAESNHNEETKPVHVVPVQLEDSELEPHFPSSKSMDNMESIVLENPAGDEDTDTDDDELLDSPSENTETTKDNTQTSSGDNVNTLLTQTQESLSMSKEMSKTTANPLAQYFSNTSDSPFRRGGGDFFDSLCDKPETAPENTNQNSSSVELFNDNAAGSSKEADPAVQNTTKDIDTSGIQVDSKSRSAEERVAESSEDKETDLSPAVEADLKEGLCVDTPAQDSQLKSVEESERIRTTSVSEEIAVAFEESKGEGLRLAPSTKNLSKFFVDGGGESSNDSEGKSFFDTFTAEKNEEVPGDQAPPSLISQESRNSESTVPPETPPLLAGTSPFHSQPPTPFDSGVQQPPVFPIVSQNTTGPVSLELENDGVQVKFESGDDPFSQSLNLSDENRSYDAWIPSEMTRQTLVTVATTQRGSYIPSPDHLTMPGVILDEPQADPVKELVKKYRGEQESLTRQTLGSASVPQNEDGLRKLIDAECYRAAVDLTAILLNHCGQGIKTLNEPSKHSPYSLQLWLVRISLLMKLHLYTTAESECLAFGNLDKPDLYFEYYPDVYPARKGCMVPFHLRVLLAELPLYLGKTQESLDRLYYIHAVIVKILGNLESGLAEDGSMVQLTDKSRVASRKVWEAREIQVLYSVGNCLLNIKDYSSALHIYESLLKKDEINKSTLLCGMGRVHLQTGDMRQAEKCFKNVEKLTATSTDVAIQSRNLMNKGFLALGQNQFKDAQQYFKEAVLVDADNAVAINNMAVTSLYTGKLKEALSTLEQLIQSNPAKYLQESILFNLCTLYELESSHAMHKKQKLLDLVSQHKGNGFNVACLKMT